MAEFMEEATCVNHHRKKIAPVFSAMRHFAAELDDGRNGGPLLDEVRRA